MLIIKVMNGLDMVSFLEEEFADTGDSENVFRRFSAA
jgi:hypothetical protein